MSLLADVIVGGAELIIGAVSPLFTPNLTKCKKDCAGKFIAQDPRLSVCVGWCKSHKSNGKAPPRDYFNYVLEDPVGQAFLNAANAQANAQNPYVVADAFGYGNNDDNKTPANATLYILAAVLLLIALIFFSFQIIKNKKD